LQGETVRTLDRVSSHASTRSLSTARSVLRVLALLVEQPAGVRADEVAAALGKSTSTAYYLLTSLCDEGFAVHESKGLYRPARGLEELTAAAEEAGQPADAAGLAGAVDELFVRTRKRSYLGVVRAGRIEITTFRGRQGVPRIPGLGSEIRDCAHALAMGKVVLARLDAKALSRYVARGLKSFTPQTITSAQELSAELEQVRIDGFAVDREEFGPNFCCVAAPIFDDRDRFAAVLGLSVSANVFDAECERLAEVVIDVAGEANVPASRRLRRGAGHNRERNGTRTAARAASERTGRARVSGMPRLAS
jgi:DNA-binding IclR family transcriptional regulator